MVGSKGASDGACPLLEGSRARLDGGACSKAQTGLHLLMLSEALEGSPLRNPRLTLRPPRLPEPMRGLLPPHPALSPPLSQVSPLSCFPGLLGEPCCPWSWSPGAGGLGRKEARSRWRQRGQQGWGEALGCPTTLPSFRFLKLLFLIMKSMPTGYKALLKSREV